MPCPTLDGMAAATPDALGYISEAGVDPDFTVEMKLKSPYISMATGACLKMNQISCFLEHDCS